MTSIIAPFNTQSVSTFKVLQEAIQGDKNRNGGIDYQEAAQLAIDASRRGDTMSYNFWGTLVQGGIQNNGLFPDYNRDNKVDLGEFLRLANSDGDLSNVSSRDFQVAFPNDFLPGGQTINNNRLQQQANGGLGQNGDANNILLKLLQLLLGFGGFNNSPTTGNTQGNTFGLLAQ